MMTGKVRFVCVCVCVGVHRADKKDRIERHHLPPNYLNNPTFRCSINKDGKKKERRETQYIFTFEEAGAK